MTDQTMRRRDSDADAAIHWDMTRQHATDISGLKESNARQEEVLASVLRSQEATREAIDTLVHRVSQPPPTTDLAKLIGTTVTVLSLFGALIIAYVSPIANGQKSNSEKYQGLLEMEREQAYQHGVLDAQLSSYGGRIVAVEELLIEWLNRN